MPEKLPDAHIRFEFGDMGRITACVVVVDGQDVGSLLSAMPSENPATFHAEGRGAPAIWTIKLVADLRTDGDPLHVAGAWR